jgi:hypothetical protein
VSALLPALLTAAGVLAVAGLAKLRSPGAAVAALAAAGIRVRPAATRAVGAVELTLAGACSVAPGRATAAAVCLAYLSFAAFVVLQLRRGGGAPCGCFGDEAAPLTRWHLGLDLAAAAIAAAAAALPPSWADAGGAPARAVTLVGVAGCTYLAHLAYTALPEAWRAASRGAA